MKSILFVISRYPGYGGIENVTTLLANQWCNQYKVIICSITQQAENELLMQLDSRVRFCKFPDNSLNKSQANINYLNTLIQKEHVDFLLYQDSYYPCQYLLTNINRYNSPKIIIVEHSSPNGFEIGYHVQKNSYPQWNIYHRFKSWFYYQKSLRNELKNRQLLYKVCNKYVMLAKDLIPLCKKYGHLQDESKFEVIGNPIVIDNSTADLSIKKKECLFVGRLDTMKGIDRLLRIWNTVEKNTDNWTLVIVGDGIMMPLAKELTNQLKLHRIRFEGFQTNVIKYYHTAQIFCMCSTYEGFPLVLPEAMGFGLVPMAFSSFAALNNIITDGEDGYAITPFNEELYTSKLIGLINNDSLRIKMQYQAIQNSQKFSVTSILAKWEALFQQLT